MKKLVLTAASLALLSSPCTLFAAIESPPTARYLAEKFEVKVGELIKAGFEPEAKSLVLRKEALLEKLRELMDKEIKKI